MTLKPACRSIKDRELIVGLEAVTSVSEAEGVREAFFLVAFTTSRCHEVKEALRAHMKVHSKLHILVEVKFNMQFLFRLQASY